MRRLFIYGTAVGLYLLLSEFLCPRNLSAQDSATNSSKQFYWASLGGGLGSLGFAGDIRLSYQNNHHRLAFRSAGTQELFVFGPTPYEMVYDYALMYGRSFDRDHITGAISAGIGIVKSVRRGKFLSNQFLFDEYERIENTTIGFPVEVNFVGVIFPAVGLGIDAFADFNKERTFGGLVFTLHIGKLK